MVDVIGRKALEKGNGQVRRVMYAIIAQLDELGERVQAHRRATPTPAFSTRTWDDMDALARSLAHLQACAKGLRDAIVGGFSKAIKVAKIVLENALDDFKVDVARTGEAARWKQSVADEW
jgi:predicted transcriptional regulator